MGEARDKNSTEDIFDEILEKIHRFGTEHLGEYPNHLYMNHDHFRRIMESANYRSYVQMDWDKGNPKTILGLKYIVKEDQAEIDVR